MNETRPDLVLISLHEKGFWQADYFAGAADIPSDEFEAMDLSPDSFFTMKRGDSRHLAVRRAEAEWPNAKIELIEDSP